LIQTTVVPLIAIGNVLPDVILILLVYYSISQGQIYGAVLGFIYGFLIDIITGTTLGSAMIAKTIAGFSAGYFSLENKKEQNLFFYNFALIVLLSSLIDSTINAFFSSIDITANIFRIFFQYALMPAIYTAVMALVVMVFFHKRSRF
jgi:rod shape-determining protein MreD